MAITYCSIEDVLFNHERIPDTADERTAITLFIEIAEGQINDKLRPKYSVPFTTIPATIRLITMDLATYYELRRLASANVSIPPEHLAQYKDNADELLSMVAGCEMSFDTDDVTRQTLVSSNTLNRVKIFDLGNVFSQGYHPTASDERYGES